MVPGLSQLRCGDGELALASCDGGHVAGPKPGLQQPVAGEAQGGSDFEARVPAGVVGGYFDTAGSKRTWGLEQACVLEMGKTKQA